MKIFSRKKINKNLTIKYCLIFIFGVIFGYFFSQIFSQKNISFNPPKRLETKNFSGLGLYEVLDVVDGDTLRIKIKDKIELVRFLGINTPEVEGKYRHQECFGKEASAKTKELLKNKKVILLPDSNSPDRGKYGRLLRYVFLPNGDFINAILIKEGYAFSSIYTEIQFKNYFNYLEKQARQNHRGLWLKCQ